MVRFELTAFRLQGGRSYRSSFTGKWITYSRTRGHRVASLALDPLASARGGIGQQGGLPSTVRYRQLPGGPALGDPEPRLGFEPRPSSLPWMRSAARAIEAWRRGASCELLFPDRVRIGSPTQVPPWSHHKGSNLAHRSYEERLIAGSDGKRKVQVSNLCHREVASG